MNMRIFNSFGFCLLSLFACTVRAGITDYNSFQIDNQWIGYERFGFLSKEDTILTRSPDGVGQPLFSGNLQIRAADSYYNYEMNKTRAVDVVLFHEAAGEWLGNEQGMYCCTRLLSSLGKCQRNQIGHLIIQEEIPREVAFPFTVLFDPYALEADFLGEFLITQSGIYYLFIANCDEHMGTIVVNGMTSWMNTFGYLSAEESPLLVAHVIDFLLYALLLLVWVVMTMRRGFRTLNRVQQYTFALITLSIAEMVLLFASLEADNRYGRTSLYLNAMASVLVAMKGALIRMALVALCMGWWVSIPGPGPATVRSVLLVLGGLYFVSSWIVEFESILSESSSRAQNPLVALFWIAVIFTNILFFLWGLTAIQHSLRKFKHREESEKFKLFTSISRLFMALVAITAFFVIMQALATLSQGENRLWRFWWFLDWWWILVNFVALLVLCVLWRPRENNDVYMYTALGGDEESSGNSNAHSPLPFPELDEVSRLVIGLFGGADALSDDDADGSDVGGVQMDDFGETDARSDSEESERVESLQRPTTSVDEHGSDRSDILDSQEANDLQRPGRQGPPTTVFTSPDDSQ